VQDTYIALNQNKTDIMQIKIREIIGMWNGLSRVYADNERLDGVFDYFMQKQNIPILQKEVQKLQDLDDDTFQDLAEQTVDLPLSRIKPDMLPSNMPKGVVGLLDPIIEGNGFNAAGYESVVAELIDKKDVKNGEGE